MGGGHVGLARVAIDHGDAIDEQRCTAAREGDEDVGFAGMGGDPVPLAAPGFFDGFGEFAVGPENRRAAIERVE